MLKNMSSKERAARRARAYDNRSEVGRVARAASAPDQPLRLEDHHPEMMKYSKETRRIINAYNGHGIAGRLTSGWDAVDVEMSEIVDEQWEDGNTAERQRD